LRSGFWKGDRLLGLSVVVAFTVAIDRQSIDSTGSAL